MDALLLVGFCDYLSSIWWRPLIVLVQRCTVALSLFTVVMLIGVLPKGSKLDMCLSQIRAELSIVACILCMGHMCMYITPYSSRVFAGSLADSMPASFIVALVLFILLVVLGVASFNFVKQRMGGATWKKVQLLAYPFFGLAWVPSCSCSLLPPCAGRAGRPQRGHMLDRLHRLRRPARLPQLERREGGIVSQSPRGASLLTTRS